MVRFPRASVSSETHDGGTVVVRLGGTVGIANVAEVATGIRDALGRTGTDVIVDLRDLTSIDSRVTRALLLALHDAEERNHAVVVIRPNPQVWRTFELSGDAGAFPNCADPIDVSPQRTGRPATDRTGSRRAAARLAVDEDARRGAFPSSAASHVRLGLPSLGSARGGDPQRGRALTPRERRVLFELARGRTTEAAAAVIGLSPHTVRSHLKSAARKLGAETRTQAVALAIMHGAIVVVAPPTRRFNRSAGRG